MEENTFLTTLKDKSKEELIYICDQASEYDPLAVEAATLLLQTQFNYQPDSSGELQPPVIATSTNTDEVLDTEQPASIEEPNPAPEYREAKGAFHYLKAFNSADAWTIAVIVLFYASVVRLINYYIYEPLFDRVSGFWFYIPLTVFVIILGHALYRRDHGFSNNYVGRGLQDIAIFFTYIFFNTLYSLLDKGETNLFAENWADNLIGFTLLGAAIMAFQLVIWGLRSLLRSLRWDLL